jgi:hypothetical protein
LVEEKMRREKLKRERKERSVPSRLFGEQRNRGERLKTSGPHIKILSLHGCEETG